MDISRCLCVSAWCFFLVPVVCSTLYSNLWAVHIKGGERKARSVAENSGFTYIDKIMDDYYHFRHHEVERRSTDSSLHHSKLALHSEVLWVAQQKIKSRKKRDILTFNDDMFQQQWYLHDQSSGGRKSSSMNMNVESVWNKGYTGRGVVVTVLDDGIEKSHPDLSQNFDAAASYDINGQDSDPTPRYDFSNDNRHGTRCAGEIAAVANNSVCGVGVAYDAGIGGIRMLDGDVTDSVEAMSLSLRRDHIDIYSASWGPDDDGKTVDGPATLARKAFRDGVARGRGGKGSIFVWASGNGGGYHDDCNCDGYTNSIYTLSVSSATERGDVPWYSEACSSTLVSTYSSGDHDERQITTTDLRGRCTDLHTGTSASAPLAAGVVALVLQANPRLTWRDVQYISVLGASSTDLYVDDWITNGAGHKVSHHFGFGLMNAGKMVDLALNWTNIPEQHICEVASPDRNIQIQSKETQTLRIRTAGCRGTNKEVQYVEHVQAKITLTSYWRGDLQIWLTSPSGTRSNLLTERVHDDSKMGFNEWGFLTTHNWGEESVGEWKLEIANGYRAGKRARLNSWSLVLYGTATHPLKSQPSVVTPTPSTTSVAKRIKDAYEGQIIFPVVPKYLRPSIVTTPKVTTTEALNIEKVDDYINHIPDQHSEPADINCPLDTYYLRDSCVDECPLGYYVGRNPKLNLACVSCHYTCAACTGPHNNTCTECYFGSQLTNGQCLSADHTVAITDWLEDDKITPSNFVNKDPDADINCPLDTYYLRDSCVDECPLGYYVERNPKLNLACVSCHYTCAACTGPHNNTCTECYFGSQLTNGQCLRAAKNMDPRAGAALSSLRAEGLSGVGLQTLVYGGITTVAILLIVLLSLLVYYRYHHHRTTKRHKIVVTKGNTQTAKAATYQPVHPTEILAGSQHSSQQELMDSDEEISSQGKTSRASIEYKYITHLPYGEPV